jgi:prepilin-type N-terminal cleavage/methylation domain-containing protein
MPTVSTRPLATLQRRRPTNQRGLSLVELMVGITIGLFIVAAASLLLSNQLNDNRRLLLETQVQQDLRAAADIISRDLRRAGYSAIAESAVANPAMVDGVTPIQNGYLPVTTTGGTSVAYSYKRPSNDSGPYSFFLDSGIVKMVISGSSPVPQDLTDKNTLVVDVFTTAETDSTPMTLPCPRDCPAAGPADACWPVVTVRDITVTIAGYAPSDPSVRRQVTTQLRLRNDALIFNAAGGLVCPL